MRELVEMQYQFEEPFIVDSSKIATKLGVSATSTDQAVVDTLNTYRPGPRPRRPFPPCSARDLASHVQHHRESVMEPSSKPHRQQQHTSLPDRRR
jgi:hypothetical protein